MKIAICSGGTGGHMFPACVLFESAKQKGHCASIITDGRGSIFCQKMSDNDKVVVDTIRFSYRKLFQIIFRLISLFVKFFLMWFRDAPDVIVGFGGLFTVIPVLTAKICGAKVIIYEQNSIIGKANKFLSRFSDLKLSTFCVGEDWNRIPPMVRKEFLKATDVPYCCDGKIKIVVIGGSQGAASFDSIIPEALSLLDADQRKNIEIIQQVGSFGDTEKLKLYYDKLCVKSTLVKFIYNIAEIMSNSQLVICRSGASTLSELSAVGRPAILVPYPKASENHQFLNAILYKNNGSAWLIEENDEIVVKLRNILEQILQNRELLKQAASNIMNNSIKNAAENFIISIESVL